MNIHRFNRQIILPGFGKESQDKLFAAKVLVIGAGGLGCPVLQFLAAAGVGNLGIADDDTVDSTNLHRQILFDEKSVGKLKSEAARDRLYEMNSEINVISYSYKITNQNILPLLKQYDMVVDCTDNFQVRYLLNDACRLERKPLIYGAIYQYEGQVSVFNVEKEGKTTNYRDLFPDPPKPDEVPDCNQAGVLGTLSGLIGTVQANEVIKLITGIGEPLIHQLFLINLLNYEPRIIKYRETEENKSPDNKEEFLSMNYEEVCGISSSSGEEIENIQQLKTFLEKENSILIDVRNEEEEPKVKEIKYIRIPLSELANHWNELEKYNSIIFLCQSGIRSAQAVQWTREKYPEKEIKHIRKGIKTIT